MNYRSRPVRWLTTALAVLTVATARPAQAQGPSLNLVPGTRVRVTASNMIAPLIANFLAVRGDTAVFIEEGGGRGVWSILLVDLRTVAKSDGERRSNKPSMIKGAVAGAVVGLVGGLIFANNVTPSDASREYNKFGTGTASMLLGAGIGAAIGSRFATEKWTDVPLRRVAVGPLLGPGARGLAASITIAF